MKFDRYEWKILQLLQQNGRLTNQELADEIGLSPTPCWRRINELNNSGVIERYVAILDRKKVGIGEVAFLHVTIDKRDEKQVKAFEESIISRSEVLECYASMGDADYLLKVAVPDVSAYDTFLSNVIFKLPNIINLRSEFALRTVKQQTSLPLDVYDGQVKT